MTEEARGGFAESADLRVRHELIDQRDARWSWRDDVASVAFIGQERVFVGMERWRPRARPR